MSLLIWFTAIRFTWSKPAEPVASKKIQQSRTHNVKCSSSWLYVPPSRNLQDHLPKSYGISRKTQRLWHTFQSVWTWNPLHRGTWFCGAMRPHQELTQILWPSKLIVDHLETITSMRHHWPCEMASTNRREVEFCWNMLESVEFCPHFSVFLCLTHSPNNRTWANCKSMCPGRNARSLSKNQEHRHCSETHLLCWCSICSSTSTHLTFQLRHEGSVSFNFRLRFFWPPTFCSVFEWTMAHCGLVSAISRPSLGQLSPLFPCTAPEDHNVGAHDPGWHRSFKLCHVQTPGSAWKKHLNSQLGFCFGTPNNPTRTHGTLGFFVRLGELDDDYHLSCDQLAFGFGTTGWKLDD